MRSLGAGLAMTVMAALAIGGF
ncbi:MAG: hypothetical protein QOI66_2257, partial [Myxococcales bacterium]|nr:hypothetical protein [Myxococcales bacterium]